MIDYPYVTSLTTSFDITPDYLGRISTINDGAADIVTYSYIGDRVAKRSYPTTTPVNSNYEYDNFGRVTDIYTTNATARDNKVDFEFGYKPNTSSIEEITFNHRSSESNDFSYDNLNRLTDVEYLDNTSKTEAFTMDLLGNRESVTIDGGAPETYAVNDATNRYDADGTYTVELTYDTAGNTTTDQNGYQYSYDYDNHITEIKDNLSALVATFTYDALGRRIEKYDAKATVTTRYYYDNNRVLLEVEDSGSGFADARYFVYGNYIDEVLMMTDVDSGNSVTDGDYYYIHDQLFSPVALFEDTGSVKERYEYNAYGKTTVLDNNFDVDADGLSDYNNPYLFTGRRLDILDSGSLTIYYYRARNYDPDTGRFLQHDPLEYVDSMNLYEYVLSDPINSFDPYGTVRGGPRFTWWKWWDVDPIGSKPHGPIGTPHTHYKWWNMGKDGKVHISKIKDPIEGGPKISQIGKQTWRCASVRAAWLAKHPVWGPAIMGAGAGGATYLGYKNVEVRYRYQILSDGFDLDNSNEKAVANYWQRNMRKSGREFLNDMLDATIKKECCDAEKVKECNQKFLNGLANRASDISLGYYRADQGTDKVIQGPSSMEEMVSLILQRGWRGLEKHEECLSAACKGNYRRCQ